MNDVNQSTDPDIYAVGDAVEKPDAISHCDSLIALANVANRQGRRVADHIAGRSPHAGPLPRHCDREGVRSRRGDRGLERAPPAAAGRPYRAIHSHPFDHATYYPGATRMATKLIFDPTTGPSSARRSSAATASTSDRRHRHGHGEAGSRPPAGRPGARLCAPVLVGQGSVNMLGYMAENVLSGDCDIVAPDELEA